MTPKEFNLSDKIQTYHGWFILELSDVKEFIRLLKEEVTKGCRGTSANCYLIKEEIDKLIGDKLMGEKK